MSDARPCVRCNETRRIHGRGLCNPCYDRMQRAGCLDDFPCIDDPRLQSLYCTERNPSHRADPGPLDDCRICHRAVRSQPRIAFVRARVQR